MKFISKIGSCLLASVLLSASAQAQWISLGVRGSGSMPTGSFAEDGSANAALIDGAKTGFGYGLDVAAGMGMFGIYGGFDHIAFDCESVTCNTEGEYGVTGVSLGLKLSRPAGSLLRPFVKGGVTFNKLKGSYGSSSNGLTSDRAPGYEIGVGADISLLGLLSLAPQVRYVGQNLKANIPGVTAPDPNGQGVNYLTFDLGFAVTTPFGR